MCEPLTRDEAERICKAHGWKLERFDPDYCFVIVPDWHQSVILPPAVLHALDPDPPPPPETFERLRAGLEKRGLVLTCGGLGSIDRDEE